MSARARTTRWPAALAGLLARWPWRSHSHTPPAHDADRYCESGAALTALRGELAALQQRLATLETLVARQQSRRHAAAVAVLRELLGWTEATQASPIRARMEQGRP